MIRVTASVAVVVALTSTVAAEISPNEITISSFNPAAAVAPISSVEGPGVKVGEGTVVRPLFGIETGVISNVFYENVDAQGSGLLRLLAQVGVASLGTARLEPANEEPEVEVVNRGAFVYRADLRLSYDLMLSSNNTVDETGGLGIGASFRGLVNPSGQFAFQFAENFDRIIRAANFETNVNTNRDINNLQLILRYQPPNRSLTGLVYYANLIDVFEREEQSFANRMMNRIGVRPQWRFLPQTQAFVDVSWGVVTPLSEMATKSTSYPLVARVGIATLLSLKTTVNIDVGYTNGFYAKGPNFSAPLIGAQVGYRYSPLGRATLGYILNYEDSINANFYRDHVIRGTIQQLYAPFIVMLQPEVHFRQYRGVRVAVPDLTGGADTRNDTIIALVGGVHYVFRDWIAGTVNYRFASDQTNYVDFSGGTPDDPSYIRHELLLGVRAAL
ncbi:MAG: hypothetical protein SFX73_15385 [Kofleriaceae bacterium]|nr:hypothetical protein [Kofleriaceae bacterium]